MPSSKPQTLIRCALSAAMLCVCAWITIPGPVPITMQTFGVFLTLQLLESRGGTMAIGLYLGLGLMGLPVFSGFQGGIGVLMGPTGGYLTGFLLTALVYRFLTAAKVPTLWALILGHLACYAFGSGWFCFAYGGAKDWTVVLLTCVAPFLLPDGVKLILARWTAERIKKVIASPHGP